MCCTVCIVWCPVSGPVFAECAVWCPVLYVLCVCAQSVAREPRAGVRGEEVVPSEELQHIVRTPLVKCSTHSAYRTQHVVLLGVLGEVLRVLL